MTMFAEFGRSVIKARQKQAERQVSAALLSFDDATLAKAGFDRSKLITKARGATYF